MGERSFAVAILGARSFFRRGAAGQRDGAHIGKAKASGAEDLLDSELREGVGIVETSELFFLDGGDDAAMVEECGGGVGTGRRDAENVHQLCELARWELDWQNMVTVCFNTECPEFTERITR